MNLAGWVERQGRPRPEAPALADGSEAPPVDELDRLCLDTIARHNRPKDDRVVEFLPTSNDGKVVKRELRDQLRAEVGADGRQPSPTRSGLREPHGADRISSARSTSWARSRITSLSARAVAERTSSWTSAAEASSPAPAE